MDEYRTMVFPVIVGGGQRLFGDGIDMKSPEHVSTRTFDSDAVVLTYRGRRGSRDDEKEDFYG